MKHKHLSSGIQKKYLKSTFILLFFALLLSMIGVWSYMHHTLKNNIIEKYKFADEKMGILLDNLYTKSKEVTAEAILNETIQKSLNAEELTDNEKNAVGKYFSYLDLDSIQDYCYMDNKGISGIRKSYEEAQKLFGIASASGASAFTIPEDLEEQEDDLNQFSEDREIRIINSIRKNDFVELKETFIDFIYHLPKEEARQCQYLHKVMLRVQFMLQDTYGMNEDMKNQFANYYSNLNHLPAVKAVDVCYKILCRAIELRQEEAGKNETGYFKEYMAEAVAYIEEHLQEEDLSIIATAAHVYLNPVYFGRIFKSTFHMTFKQYLVKKRMDKAKRMLEEGDTSIRTICEEVGISNPSYFSQLFKQYTGKLPSEYKKEYEV